MPITDVSGLTYRGHWDGSRRAGMHVNENKIIKNYNSMTPDKRRAFTGVSEVA